MREFLRYLFVVAAMLMVVVGDVWAEDCVIFSDNGPYEMMTSGSSSRSKEFTISNPRPCNQLVFTNKHNSSWATGGVKVTITYSDGTKTESTKGNGTHTINLNRKIVTKLHFNGTGTLKKTLSDITLTQATYVDAPTGFTDNQWNAGTDVVGNAVSTSGAIAWSNTSFSCSLENNTDSQFEVSVSSTGAGCSYGTSTISVRYKREKPGTHSATLKIAGYEIKLKGVTGKYTPQAAKKADMVMNASYNPSDIFDVYYLANNNKSNINDYTITALDPILADYVDGQIVTNYRTGTARFRLTRGSNNEFEALDATISVNVNPAGGCLVLDAPNEYSFTCSLLGEDKEYTPADFNGVPYQLSFEAETNNNDRVGNVKIQQYVNGWQDIEEINPNEGYDSYGPYELSEQATKIRFFNTYGSYQRHFRNVTVTRKTYLRPSISSLALPQATIGKRVSASFDLNWSTCSDEIVLVSTNSNFVLDQYSIDATSGRGTTTITVTYDANSGSQSGTIIIYDQTHSIELEVRCEVKAKLATEIVYTGDYRFAEANACMEGLFSVMDENGDVVADAEIVLASSNEAVLEVCGNAGFQTHCGGQVILTATYSGDELREGASWSEEMFVENCNQVIVWNQNFRDYIAAADGRIDESRVLNAYADPTRFEVTYELDAAAQAFARLENGSLVVTGIGTGHIIASAPAGMYQGKMYDATSVMHEIRVSRAGDECETEELLTSDEITLSDVLIWYPNSKEFALEGRPYDRMEFYAHVSNESLNNKMTVTFSTDNGASWGTSSQFDIPREYDWANPFMCTFIPDGANRVKFTTTSTTNTYFNMVKMVQESYLRAKDMVGNNLAEIVIDDAIVNEPFSRTFTVEYSDVPLIQYSVTDSHDLGLKLEPNPTISNDCGDWGTYTFTLTGESPYPQSGVIEKIRLYTSAGDEVVIPITITATLSEPFYFDVQDGDWNEPTNWTHKGSTTHGMVPDKRFPVVVSRALQIGNESTTYEAVAYNVTIEGNGRVNIGSKGGLTLHAGGFAEGVTEDNFVIDNTPQGAGYVRVSPYFINKVPGTMPSIKVNYTTKAYNGVWQYFGAPGSNATLYGEGNTQVYLWSEPYGWMPDDGSALSAFEGYALTQYNGENASYSLIATPICANKTINLTKTSNGMNGDNLFVNSYLAPIDLTKFTDMDDELNDPNDDFRGDFEKTFYLFNSGSWDDWQNNGGSNNNGFTSGDARGQYFAITPLSVKLLDTNIEQTVIPSMQGVYVIANENGASIKLDYNKHVYKAEAANMHHHMRAPEITDRDFMRVRMQVGSMNSGADRLYVIQYKEGTSGFDNGYDARNILAEGQANIYTSEQDGEMEISVSDKVDGTYIGFAAGGDSEYVLRLASVVGEMYLKDTETDTVLSVLDGVEYRFMAVPNSVNNQRFLLLDHYEAPGQGDGVVTGLETQSGMQVWVANDVAYITNAPIYTKLVVYTMSAVVVKEWATSAVNDTFDLSGMPTGVYMLRVNEKAYKFVKK